MRSQEEPGGAQEEPALDSVPCISNKKEMAIQIWGAIEGLGSLVYKSVKLHCDCRGLWEAG